MYDYGYQVICMDDKVKWLVYEIDRDDLEMVAEMTCVAKEIDIQ